MVRGFVWAVYKRLEGLPQEEEKHVGKTMHVFEFGDMPTDVQEAFTELHSPAPNKHEYVPWYTAAGSNNPLVKHNEHQRKVELWLREIGAPQGEAVMIRDGRIGA